MLVLNSEIYKTKIENLNKTIKTLNYNKTGLLKISKKYQCRLMNGNKDQSKNKSN